MSAIYGTKYEQTEIVFRGPADGPRLKLVGGFSSVVKLVIGDQEACVDALELAAALRAVCPSAPILIAQNEIRTRSRL